MVINCNAVYGKDFGPGWLMFSYRPGFLSHNIAMETADGLQSTGQLVATHAGWVTHDGHIAEALGKGFSLTPITHYVNSERGVFVWFRKPLGMTDNAAKAMTDLAYDWRGRDYDFLGVSGFVLPFVGQNADALFCSEAVVIALLEVAKLLSRPLPTIVRQRSPHKWSPHALDTCRELYIPLAA